MAGEDKLYTKWIKGLPCRMCAGRPVDPHHPTHLRHGGEGARRAHDRNAIPLCSGLKGCHRQLHDLTGPFKGWNRDRLRAWQNEQITMLEAQFRPGDQERVTDLDAF